MKRWVVLICVIAAGCTTTPTADLAHLLIPARRVCQEPHSPGQVGQCGAEKPCPHCGKSSGSQHRCRLLWPWRRSGGNP